VSYLTTEKIYDYMLAIVTKTGIILSMLGMGVTYAKNNLDNGITEFEPILYSVDISTGVNKRLSLKDALLDLGKRDTK
jgi:hypothetical protein